MSVLVLSCGRSGTNLTLEILRGASELSATNFVEDKNLFIRPRALAPDYLSKCDTHYIKNLQNIQRVMDQNTALEIVWTIRDPRDMILSKLKRGQQGSDGNLTTADDATEDGCLNDLNHMYNVYCFFKKNYPQRLHLIKMEDIILNFESTISQLCENLSLEYNSNFKNFQSRMRNKFKSQRYKGLDKNQVALWRNYNSIYNNFFKTNKFNLKKMFLRAQHLIDYFQY